MKSKIQSICPAPPDLIIHFSEKDGRVSKEKVAAFALIEEEGGQHVACLVLNNEAGTLEPVDTIANFQFIKWQTELSSEERRGK